SRQRLGRHFALAWVIQRAARSRQRQISAFWHWRLAPAPATAPILRQREWEESIGSGAVVAETAPRRQDASAEPATARVEEDRQDLPDAATDSEVDSSTIATATAPQAAVTTLAEDLRTQPEPAASDEVGQEEGEAPHCGTWTVADRVQDLERKEEEVRSQSEDEKVRRKASSGQREGLRTAAQEDAKKAPSGRTPEDAAAGGTSGGGGDGLRTPVLREEISDRFSSAPARASSPVCRGHSSPQTGETGFATARGGGGAGYVPDATRQTEGVETPMTSSSAPPMSDVRGLSPQVLEGLSASNMTSATGESELQEPPSAAASSSHMNDIGDTLPERAGTGSHAGIDGDRAGSRPEAIRTSEIRLPYQGETADAVRDFLPFFRDHFDVTIRRVPLESAVNITGKAEDGVVNVAAECFEHGLRVCRDNDVKAADFLLLRARVRSARDPDGSQYLLPLEVSAKLRRRLRDLGDRYGVVINSVPSRSVGLGSGGGGSGGGGGGLPQYLCCPRVDTDDDTQDHRKVVQIWGLRNCVIGAFDRVVASLLDHMEYVVKLGPVGADERKRLRFKGKNVNYVVEGGVTEVRISGRPHLAAGNISTVLQSLPERLPNQVQCVSASYS
ncbi:unnamed protein product, partial [Ectocarpus sp. 13 AM-2016]